MSAVEEILKPYKPMHPVDVLFDGIAASREFTRKEATNEAV